MKWGAKWGGLLSGLAGLGLAAWLLASYGIDRIFDLLAHAGVGGVAIVVLFHLVQLLFSAAAWRAITAAGPGFGLDVFVLLRWVREGINNLLPVAQIGGEFVTARLLQRRGMSLPVAIAGAVADLTMEMLTQIAFTLLGLALLLHRVGGAGGLAGSVASGLVAAGLVAALFLGAQWLGLASLMERGLLRLGRALGWAGTGQVAGLHAALIACYRRRRHVARAAVNHSVSWLLGGAEVCLALHLLGHDVGLEEGLVIESLGQALKAAGFAVPGALGVQEGGLIIVCQAFGLAPELAIALSLMKRLREVLLGVPALLAWHRLERAPRALAGTVPP